LTHSEQHTSDNGRQAVRISLVIHSLQAGGMERVMAELANHFAMQSGTRVDLVLYGIKRDVFYPLDQRINLIRPSFPFRAERRFLSTLRTIFFLRKTIRNIAPQVVLSFGEVWNNFVLLSLLGTGIPVFVSDRSQPDKPLGKIQQRLRKWLYPRARGIIAQTAKARDIYSAMGLNRRIEVIGNPIRSIAADTTVAPARKKVVLMVGRLIDTKHQDKLIEMFVDIREPGWQLVIVGYDHLKQQHMSRLQQLVKDRHAEDIVWLAGKQSKVDAFYLSSEIFAFTSSSEGFPNVIGEAMSAGLPVVAFDCVAGPAEMIVPDQTGYLVPLFDYPQFQEKLARLMRDPALRKKFADNGRQKIREFDARQIGDRYFHTLTHSLSISP
jgi:GalNAc-alpha-(1->4)-GalNAc-alpha-(1->3)-diNAcBac-PP-undecaprenol alpha-1,4-N-acetyl-D-galactosaminyltransferase